MSILSIGERNISNYHSPYFTNSHDQVNIAKRQKKIKQQQYRLELITQINQKYERTKRQRQNQFLYNRKYERMHTQQPYVDYRGEVNQQPISYQRKYENNNPSNSFQRIRRKLSQLDNQFPTSFSYVEKPTTPFRNQYQQTYTPYDARTKTQDRNTKQKFDSIVVDLQRRRKQLSTYENKRIEEVYQKMYDSVQQLNDQSQQNNYSSFTPLKESIQSRKYKNKDLASRSMLNPQQQSVNKLPSLFKNGNAAHQGRAINGSQRDWKEWYAKQKLRQLQSYYRKIAANQSTPKAHLQPNSGVNLASRLRNYHY